jgi:mycoredoxin
MKDGSSTIILESTRKKSEISAVCKINNLLPSRTQLLDDGSQKMLQIKSEYQLRGEKYSEMTDHYNFKPSQIVMYSTEYCADCLRAKKFFEVNDIPYLNVGLEGNPEATEFVLQINEGYRSVPTIIFPDGSILVEPSWEELKAKIQDRDD